VHPHAVPQLQSPILLIGYCQSLYRGHTLRFKSVEIRSVWFVICSRARVDVPREYYSRGLYALENRGAPRFSGGNIDGT
jgi:hypothetical protein